MFPSTLVHPTSSYFNVEHTPEEKYSLKPTYEMFGHDLKINFVSDFMDLDFDRA